MNIQQYQDYDAFIFDMDGTLIDSLQQHQAAWERVLKHFAIPYTAQQMLAMSGMPAEQTVENLLAQANMTRIKVDAVVEAKNQHYQDLVHAEIQATPLLTVFNHFQGKKPMSVGTGASQQEAEFLLNKLGIAEQLVAIVGADLVDAHKPAPDTFLLCAKLMNVEPQRCLVFEDADAGIMAAKAASMDVVDVRPLWPNKYFDQHLTLE
ncbi:MULTISPECIES: beta-phosphoglucomutase family hydrolase [unclassified Agarivorans]|uniref:beta-phosphoglucomutase family hydrolase n=1 Tax=unclassified Agarivorans TaxID=2636026 RepID=UPI003D7E5E3A